MSLLHCLGVPAHINKRITQNLTNSRWHSISVDVFFPFFFFFFNFQGGNRHFVSSKERRRDVQSDMVSQRLIDMPTISFVSMLGKTDLQHEGEKGATVCQCVSGVQRLV